MSQAKIILTAEDRASRVLQQVQGQMASATASAGQLAASAGLIGPAFATLASAAGLVAFVRNVTGAVDALNDVADAPPTFLPPPPSSARHSPRCPLPPRWWRLWHRSPIPSTR